MPTTSSANLAILVDKDLIYALCNPHPAVPYTSIGDAQLHALNMADIFNSTFLGVGAADKQTAAGKTIPLLLHHPMAEPIAIEQNGLHVPQPQRQL